ncbi:MAG: polysaccharide biosynthesis/export family protein [Leptolyngbyaceae cyanobacterium bins.59]|nr:polysaccharide biosynthesis/export family protein [Leptolyngbyaceae cyanobacterium bins.59]
MAYLLSVAVLLDFSLPMAQSAEAQPIPPTVQPAPAPPQFTLPPPPATSPGVGPTQRPTTRQLLEEARQRLRERGELPPLDPQTQTPVGPATLQDPLKTPLYLYRLGPGDGVAITVQRFADLSTQAALDPEGKVTLPLVGRLSLEGLTLEQSQEKLRIAFNEYVINPVVQVSVVRPRPIQVTIVGEVASPGFYALGGGANAGTPPRISNALVTAGGSTDRADLRAVRLRRVLNDGSFIEQDIDLFTPLKRGDAIPDINLQDRDVLLVPRLQGDGIQDYDRSLVARSTLSRPVINVRVLSYAGGGIGRIQLPNGSTFIDALTAIGPNPDVANLGNIALIRFDPEQGRAVTREINGESVLRGDITQNIPLEDNDVIVVGRNLIGQITYALNVVTQPFRDVLGFLLFFDSLAGSAGNLFRPRGADR